MFLLGKATTPTLKRYQRANRRMLLKPTNLFQEHPNTLLVEDVTNIQDVETGISCNTELKM